MTIFVHGALGFVGTHLVKRLRADGHIVTTVGRAPYDIPWQTFDVLINCAAELTKEDEMWGSNVSLVHDLLELARKGLTKRLIQIGSSSEYGRTVLPRAESTLCTPTNVYEATKLAATALCQGYAERYDLDIVVARPFSLYGANDKPRKLIPTLYQSALDHTPVSVHGESGHDWLYIDDFVDGIIRLLGAPRAVTKGQIFNFGTGVSSSNRQVVAALEEALGSSLNVTYQPNAYHAHDVDHWVADSSKARSILGWSPRYNLRAGIKEYVMAEWFNEDKG